MSAGHGGLMATKRNEREREGVVEKRRMNGDGGGAGKENEQKDRWRHFLSYLNVQKVNCTLLLSPQSRQNLKCHLSAQHALTLRQL